MDDCTKELSASGRRTRRMNPKELAGAEKNEAAGASRYVNVTQQNSRQKKAEKAARTFFLA